MIEQILNSWKQQPVQVLSTLGVLTGILSVCFSFLVVQGNLNQVLTRWGSDFKLNIYLTDDATDENRELLKQEVSGNELFNNTQFITKDKALENFRSRLGFLGNELVEGGTLENPLPASVEATINSGISGFTKKLEVFSNSLLKRSYIEDVSWGQNWVENYSGMVKASQYVCLVVGLILLAGALLLAASTIKGSIFLRHEEIEILELFGATRWMIAKPFIVEGALLGAISGVISIFVVFAIFQASISFMSAQLKMWNLYDVVSFSNALVILLFIATCSALGALGSMMSVRKINTGWAAAEK